MDFENEQYEENNVIILNDENGNEVEFEFLDLIEYEENEYVVLIPPDDDSVVILKVEGGEDDENENYVGIDDEELLMKLFEIFKKNNSDVFDFED